MLKLIHIGVLLLLGTVPCRSGWMAQSGDYSATMDYVPSPNQWHTLVMEIVFTGPQGTRYFHVFGADEIYSFVLGSAGVVAFAGSGTADPYARVVRYDDISVPGLWDGDKIDTTQYGSASYPRGTWAPYGKFPRFYIQNQELWASLYWADLYNTLPGEGHRFENNFHIFMGEQAIPEPLPAGLLIAAAVLLRIIAR